MNQFNKQELQNDETGLLESCDACNKLIINWDTLTNCFLTFDNKIVCLRCKKEQDELSSSIPNTCVGAPADVSC